MADLARDVRYGLRMLGKDPGQTAAAAVALGLSVRTASCSSPRATRPRPWGRGSSPCSS
jgi:hypothetical protein